MIDQLWEWIAIAVGILVVLGGVLLGLVRGGGGRTKQAPRAEPRTDTEVLPGVGDDATEPRDAPKRSVEDVGGGVDTLPAPETLPEPEPVPSLERPDSAQGRLTRLRARLSRSNTA
ncbi:MAG: signal recognition particle-docking protein FtsY, partial [Pedococcus sp.]